MRAAKVGKRLLVVEGYSDKRFFLGLQRHIGLSDTFDVTFPGELLKHPGKVGAQKTFNLWLEEAAEPSRFESIGICVDADFAPESGFLETKKHLKSLLAGANFRMVDADRNLYQHNISGCKASYWIAPSHGADGYLESLALGSLKDEEAEYLKMTIQPFLAGLNPARFESKNSDRAALYMYLATQRKPDKSLPTLLDDKKVDLAKNNMAVLCQWLINLFE